MVIILIGSRGRFCKRKKKNVSGGKREDLPLLFYRNIFHNKIPFVTVQCKTIIFFIINVQANKKNIRML